MLASVCLPVQSPALSPVLGTQSVRERQGLASRQSEKPIQTRKRFSAKGIVLPLTPSTDFADAG